MTSISLNYSHKREEICMAEPTKTYVHLSGQRGIFCEVYFPRRVVAQGTIFTALKEGHHESYVKKYLTRHITKIFQEMEDYRHVFHPHQYDKESVRSADLSEQDALERIKMYQSPFYGWSNYVVDGVFWDDKDVMFEEATQVIRIMFKIESTHLQKATKAKCQDVLRAMLYWFVTRQALIIERSYWDEHEQARFMAQQEPWPEHKQEFVNKNFASVAKEVKKWRDDCLLFVFGYLIRQFSERLSKLGIPEKEIWGTSLFNMNIGIRKLVEE